MVNQYGQTDIVQALLAQGTSQSPYKTPLGQAARLGGIALAEYGKSKGRERQQSDLAAALAGINREGMTAAGPTQEAAGRAPISDPELMARLLSNKDTAQLGQSLLGRALQPEPQPEAYTLGPGQQRFVGGERVAGVPANDPTPTSSMREYELAREQGYGGTFQQYQADLKKAGATNVTTNVTPTGPSLQETEEQKARGKDLVAEFGAVREAGDNARQQRAMLQQAIQVNEMATAPSELRQVAGNMAVSLGFDPESVGLGNITTGQQFNGVMQNLVLAKMQAQKGPQTENDAKRIEMTVASLGNTPAAREFLLNSAMNMNQLEILKERHWQDWWEQNGTYDGAASAWNKGLGNERFVATNPKSGVTVFLPEFMARAKEVNPDATMEQILELWRDYE